MVKRKRTIKSPPKARPKSEDAKQRRKYAKGKRIEAYTFGEALGSKKWP